MSYQKKSDVREIYSQHVLILERLIRPQACVILRDYADENQCNRHGSYELNYSAVQGLANGKLVLSLSATNYFKSKHAKSFVYHDIKCDLQLTTVLPNRSK